MWRVGILVATTEIVVTFSVGFELPIGSGRDHNVYSTPEIPAKSP